MILACVGSLIELTYDWRKQTAVWAVCTGTTSLDPAVSRNQRLPAYPVCDKGHCELQCCPPPQYDMPSGEPIVIPLGNRQSYNTITHGSYVLLCLCHYVLAASLHKRNPEENFCMSIAYIAWKAGLFLCLSAC